MHPCWKARPCGPHVRNHRQTHQETDYDGRLVAGHKLPAEREMARQFKTSRVSVREAYRSLEELGLLRIRRGAEGGAFMSSSITSRSADRYRWCSAWARRRTRS